MNKKIILVDDDKNLLNSIVRQLRGKYEIYPTEFPADALEHLKKNRDTALVISDYKMPEMNGAEFLKKCAGISPDTVRMMLTGQADMQAVIGIINESGIFRFIAKPCPPDLFIKNIEDALLQYRLITSEKELLSKTLSGSIQVMMDITVLAKPQIFARSMRIRNYAGRMLSAVNAPAKWQIEIAAVMSQIGCITIPDEILQNVFSGVPLEEEDRALYMLYTKTSSEIIGKIPRLEPVAKIIKYQEKSFDGEGIPDDGTKGSDLPIGSRILKIAIDYDGFITQNITHEEAVKTMRSRKGKYDESILDVLDGVLAPKKVKKEYSVEDIPINRLNTEMHLAREIKTSTGIIIGSIRQPVSQSLIQTLQNYAQKKMIPDTVRVFIFES